MFTTYFFVIITADFLSTHFAHFFVMEYFADVEKCYTHILNPVSLKTQFFKAVFIDISPPPTLQSFLSLFQFHAKFAKTILLEYFLLSLVIIKNIINMLFFHLKFSESFF